MKKFLDSIDWKQLHKQKMWLINNDSEESAGLLSLIDCIQDTAVDEYGYPGEKVFPHRQKEKIEDEQETLDS